jgi:predicted ABC-type transport system involved in lysophospholipase L1 biosynthesis ATPase subunit
MNPAPEIRLEFDRVSLDALRGRWDVGLRDASFALRGGELAIVRLEARAPRHSLPDLARGLAQPDSGTVRVRGRDWAGLAPDAAAAERGRIGHSFGEGVLLSNLDLDENITLPLRYHARLSPDEARDRAMEWARFFGWDALPSERPAWVSQETRQVAQWVRALAGQPDLYIWDRPCAECSDELSDRFAESVLRELRRGAAALWLVPDDRGIPNAVRPEVRHFFRCCGPLLETGEIVRGDKT